MNFNFRNIFNKPEYLYRPSQILKRLIYPFQQGSLGKEILPWGHEIKFASRTVIGKSIATFGLYDLSVCESVFRILSPGDQCLDIGANIGAITSAMSYKVSSQGKVHAFEPHPTNYQELKRNIDLWFRLKVLNNITLYEIALSEKKGELSFYIPESFNQNPGIGSLNKIEGAQEIKVKVDVLDDCFLKEKFQLMKMDVEGHELAVLKGAQRLLKGGNIQNIIFEDHNIASSNVVKYLEGFNCKFYRLNKTLKGVVLSDILNTDLEISYEAPNFIATLDPEQLTRRFKNPGYTCLKKP